MVGLDTPYSDPWHLRGPKRGFRSLSHAFWWNLNNTKVAEHPNKVGVGHCYELQIQFQKDLGPFSMSKNVYEPRQGIYVAGS